MVLFRFNQSKVKFFTQCSEKKMEKLNVKIALLKLKVGGAKIEKATAAMASS